METKNAPQQRRVTKQEMYNCFNGDKAIIICFENVNESIHRNSLSQTLSKLLKSQSIGFEDRNIQICKTNNELFEWAKANKSSVKLILAGSDSSYLSGLNLLKKIKEDTSLLHLDVVLFSYSDHFDIENYRKQIRAAAEYGVSEYIIWPTTVKILEEKLIAIVSINKSNEKVKGWIYRGIKLFQERQYNEALKYFQQARQEKSYQLALPDSTYGYNSIDIWIGKCLMFMGHLAQAKAYFQRVIQQTAQEGSLMAKNAIAELAALEKDVTKEIESLRQISDLSADPARLRHLAELYFKQSAEGDRESERKALIALEESTLHDRLQNRDAGEMCMAHQLYEPATHFFKKYLHTNKKAIPDMERDERQMMIDVFNKAGIALRKLKKYQEAIHEYKRALSYGPKDQNIHYNIGKAYREYLNNINKTGTSDAYDIDDINTQAFDHLNRCIALCEDQITKAQIKKIPIIEQSYIHLTWGLALFELRNPKDAVEHLQTASTLNPDNNEVKKALELISRNINF